MILGKVLPESQILKGAFHMKRTLAVALATMILINLLASCDPAATPADTTAETPETTATVETEVPTETPTESTPEETTEEPSEEVTEVPTEELESHRPNRGDWEKNDPQNPYYNLVQVGTSYDGKTPVYDGRYEFDYVICHTSDGAQFYSMQDALDWLEGYGGNIQMDADPNVCLKLDIPDDGCFYRIAYWWKNCDFVMDYGIIYDDQNDKNGVVGYAYYSDLNELDKIPGLENTYIWVVADTYDMIPGYYRIVTNDDPDSELYYGYDLVEMLDQWPGLPNGEILPE